MLDEAAGCDDFVAGLRPATRGTKGKSAGRLASGSSQRGWRRHRAKGGVFAFAQHLPSEGPVRLSHLVPKTSLDGGDAALARSGSAGVFDMTVD
jgi:hypothetical protein